MLFYTEVFSNHNRPGRGVSKLTAFMGETAIQSVKNARNQLFLSDKIE